MVSLKHMVMLIGLLGVPFLQIEIFAESMFSYAGFKYYKLYSLIMINVLGVEEFREKTGLISREKITR
jgi:hypothetical protein